MRKMFFRLLAGILCVCLVCVGFTAGATLIRYRLGVEQWKRTIYEEYVSYFTSQVENEIRRGTLKTSFRDDLNKLPDNRVSGILFYGNQNGDYFGVGVTPKGETVNTQASATGKTEEETITETIVSVTYTTPFSARISTQTASSKISGPLPGISDISDIVGSITLEIDGTGFGTVYVLAHTPATYPYFSSLFRGVVRAAILSLAGSIILALILASVISYNSTKTVSDIGSTISKLAAPHDTEVPMPENKNEFVNDIYKNASEVDAAILQMQHNRQQWLKSISHDLNTPVASLKIVLDAIDDGLYDINNPEVLSSIAEETATLEKRVRKITDYSMLLNRTEAQVGEVPVNELIDTLRTASDQDLSDVSFCIECESVKCDLALTCRALCELISNALVFRQAGTPVSVSLSPGLVSVKNSGSISPDTDFFEPWSKGDASRGDAGTGMGLPIVARIMQLQNGKAEITAIDPQTVEARLIFCA